MDYQEFLKYVLNGVNADLPADLAANYRIVKKNNGTELTGMSLSANPNCRASPILYMEPFFAAYKEGTSLQKIIADIAACMQKTPPEFDLFEKITDISYVREHLIFRLVGRTQNREALKEQVHRTFLDMAVVYAVIFSSRETGEGLVAVTNGMASNWGLSEPELYEIAERNTRERLGEKLVRFEDILPLPDGDFGKEMFLLSNREAFYGATVMLYSEKIRELSGLLGSPLYILPSSVHELIITKKNEEALCFLKKTVREVNRTEVRREDVLTDTVYCFDPKKNVISVA